MVKRNDGGMEVEKREGLMKRLRGGKNEKKRCRGRGKE